MSYVMRHLEKCMVNVDRECGLCSCGADSAEEAASNLLHLAQKAGEAERELTDLGNAYADAHAELDRWGAPRGYEMDPPPELPNAVHDRIKAMVCRQNDKVASLISEYMKKQELGTPDVAIKNFPKFYQMMLNEFMRNLRDLITVKHET